VTEFSFPQGKKVGGVAELFGGLTKRELFTLVALHAMGCSPSLICEGDSFVVNPDSSNYDELLAQVAVHRADATLAALEQQREKR